VARRLGEKCFVPTWNQTPIRWPRPYTGHNSGDYINLEIRVIKSTGDEMVESCGTYRKEMYTLS
jgi:hypothetical protein